MIEPGYAIVAILAMALATFALRALPFVASRWLKTHAAVGRLGQFLPLAIMVLLLLHAGSQAAREHPAGPWPEALALLLVIAVQWRWRQPLPAMLLGAGLYVFLRNAPLF